MANPIVTALRGKGVSTLIRRTGNLTRNYGLAPDKLDRALKRFAAILDNFGCQATFPITAVALGRNPSLITVYQDRGIEFAVHGYRHVDYCQLDRQEQQTHIASAKALFDDAGIRARGFRGPYLHANDHTLFVVQEHGLAYDSSQGLAWDVLEGAETPAYRHVLGFYGALPANEYPSLPTLQDGLVRIPYSLPDDEALANRLSLQTPEQMNTLWLAVLRRSYELGELFTVGLHPERTFICEAPLIAVLSRARQLDPPVWIAQLDEIAAWWQARTEATVNVRDVTENVFQVAINGPDGVSALVRGVEVDVPVLPWADGYAKVQPSIFTVSAPLRPFVGLSPTTSPALRSFVQQQGYVVEISEQRSCYACYVDQGDFTARDERRLLTQIEGGDGPMVRLGRWPNGARSALSITGDIDALTLWDYGLRLFGK